MKIVFTGGLTGGHFYPLIAVAEAVRDISAERRLVAPRLYYVAPTPFDEQALFQNEIVYIKTPAGKWRRYGSIQNITGMFVTLWGTLRALIVLFQIYPDVVFSKGGGASVPTVLAARVLGIPLVIHESDARPGRATLLASRFADRIAVAFDSVTQYLPLKARSKVARTGIPLRKELLTLDPTGAAAFLSLDTSVPTVLVLGGSLGSRRINETVLGGLADLVGHVNVIHQTGKDNYEETLSTAQVILSGNPHASRYHAYPYLTVGSLRQAASAAHVIVSRAGATAIAEIALWQRPSILIPIPESVSHDQRTNAYAYAHTGAAVVLEEANLTPHVLVSEVRRITSDPALARSMGEHSLAFAQTDAARIIAEELLRIGLSHEPVDEPVVAPS